MDAAFMLRDSPGAIEVVEHYGDLLALSDEELTDLYNTDTHNLFAEFRVNMKKVTPRLTRAPQPVGITHPPLPRHKVTLVPQGSTLAAADIANSKKGDVLVLQLVEGAGEPVYRPAIRQGGGRIAPPRFIVIEWKE